MHNKQPPRIRTRSTEGQSISHTGKFAVCMLFSKSWPLLLLSSSLCVVVAFEKMEWTANGDGPLPSSERYREKLRKLCDLLDKGQLPPKQPNRNVIKQQCRRLREALALYSVLTRARITMCCAVSCPRTQEERGLGGGFSLPSLPKEVRFALVGLAVVVVAAKFAEQKTG